MEGLGAVRIFEIPNFFTQFRIFIFQPRKAFVPHEALSLHIFGKRDPLWGIERIVLILFILRKQTIRKQVKWCNFTKGV